MKLETELLEGDTVNVASRMESTGMPSSVQISYRVVRALPDPSKFVIITRGRIHVKGKGNMKTFLLLNRADSKEPPLVPRIASEEVTEEVWRGELCSTGVDLDLETHMSVGSRIHERHSTVATLQSASDSGSFGY